MSINKLQKDSLPGYFGDFGGRFAPETLIQPLVDLERHYLAVKKDAQFQKELNYLLKNFIGRKTPLYLAENLAQYLGVSAKIYLKREDLNHTGAHKINNCVGQILLAKKMGKTRIVAETGAGQHGVATASVATRFGMECVIYMGEDDVKRQYSNVRRMQQFGATVIPVTSGSRTLKDAVSEAMRDWVTNIKSTHYLLGSALGPHPYPTMVRDFQSIIGQEARSQFLEYENGQLPHELVACVGGGSNAIGLFHAFLDDAEVKMTGVEAGGKNSDLGSHAARFQGGRVGFFQGTKTYLLQDAEGQIANTHSISAGLDYAAVGPEHAFLHSIQRVKYTSVTDDEALKAFKILARTEGIIPALESSHALAYAFQRVRAVSNGYSLVVNLSGRGDKDLDIINSAGELKC